MSTNRGDFYIPTYSIYQTLGYLDAVARPVGIVVPLGNFERSSCDWLRIEFSLCNPADHSVLVLMAIFDSLTCGGLAVQINDQSLAEGKGVRGEE